MGDAKANTTSPSVHERGNEHPKAFSLDMPSLFLQIPQRLQNCVKSQLKKLAHEGSEAKSVLSTESKSLTAVKSNLDKQLKAWKENPVWVEQSPEIKVNVPKGSLCNLNVKVKVGLPPDAIFDIVTDPDNRRVFKNIKEVTSRRVLLDEGSRQVVEVEQAALWRFLWWSGTISVHVMVDQNRDDYSMKFKQVKTGFMKQFEGCWTLQPLFVDEKICFPFKPRTWDEYDRCTRGKGRVGSIVNLEQLIQPALVPPPPISWYLRGITTRTTEMLINDLLAEAARIRGDFTTAKYGLEAESSQNTGDEDLLDTVDIKKRWIQRRRGTGRHKEHRRR